MRFTLSENVRTNSTRPEITVALWEQFLQISASAYIDPKRDHHIMVNTIAGSFGSANRRDVTEVRIEPKDGGMLLVAEIRYRPSVFFWILTIILIFTTYIGWVIPLAFYLMQQKSVKNGVRDVFKYVNDKFQVAASATTQMKVTTAVDHVVALEKLGQLRAKGIVTEDEFAKMKADVLSGS